nr:hypothetical protein [Leptospira weilii]
MHDSDLKRFGSLCEYLDKLEEEVSDGLRLRFTRS